VRTPDFKIPETSAFDYRSIAIYCTGTALGLSAYRRGVTLDFSRDGKPTDNAFIESFNGSSGLNAHWFMTLDDVRRKCEAFRRDYNEERPHSAIGNKVPIELVDRGMRPTLTEAHWKKGRQPGPRMGSGSEKSTAPRFLEEFAGLRPTVFSRKGFIGLSYPERRS
jgi:putative transposase